MVLIPLFPQKGSVILYHILFIGHKVNMLSSSHMRRCFVARPVHFVIRYMWRKFLAQRITSKEKYETPYT